MRATNAAMHQVRSVFGNWKTIVAISLALSLALSVVGFRVKSQVVTMLPAADESASAPTGFANYLTGGIDSWKPMGLALAIFHGPHGDELFETLKDFQLGGARARDMDLSRFDDTKKFQYPLTSLLPVEFLRSMGIGSVENLNEISTIFYVLCVLASGALAVKVGFPVLNANNANFGNTETKLVLFCLGCAASILFYPQFAALVKGNIQIWIDSLFVLSCLTWLAGLPLLTGILVALAAVIKPQLGAMLVWALVWRQWRFALGLLCAAVPISIAALAYFGVHNNLAYLDVLNEISHRGERFFINESVNGMMHRLIDGSEAAFLKQDVDYYAPYRPVVYIATLMSFLLFVLVALLPAFVRRGQNPKVEDFLVAAICFTLGSPIVWHYHYGILLPIYIISLFQVLTTTFGRTRVVLLITLGGSWVLCATYAPMVRLIYQAPWNLAANPHFFAAIMLLVVLATTGRLFSRRGGKVDPAAAGPASRVQKLTRRSEIA